MTKHIKNITGEDPRFPEKQTLAYREKGKGNVPEFKNDPKKMDIVHIKAGESIETKLNGENIVGEPRLVFIDEKKGRKEK